MFIMEYETDYGDEGEIELDAVTEDEAQEEAENLAEERPDIRRFTIDER